MDATGAQNVPGIDGEKAQKEKSINCAKSLSLRRCKLGDFYYNNKIYIKMRINQI